jgi:hypothetical protein
MMMMMMMMSVEKAAECFAGKTELLRQNLL